jgi:hypothetical protein
VAQTPLFKPLCSPFLIRFVACDAHCGCDPFLYQFVLTKAATLQGEPERGGAVSPALRIARHLSRVKDLTRVERKQAGGGFQQGRFAGAIFADKQNDFTSHHFQVDLFKHLARAAPNRNAADPE